MRMQSSFEITRLEENNEYLTGINTALEAFITDNSLQSLGYDNLKMKCRDFVRVNEVLIRANNADIDDHRRLGGLLNDLPTANIVGSTVLHWIDASRDGRDGAQEMIDHYTNVRDNSRLRDRLNPLDWTFTRARQNIHTYTRLRDNYIATLEEWEEIAESYHRFERMTAELFTIGNQLRAEAIRGVGYIGEAASNLPNSYHAPELTAWRRDIREKKAGLDELIHQTLRELYELLNDPNANPEEIQALLDRLAKMTPEEIMSLVFNIDGERNYGSRQASPLYRFQDRDEAFVTFLQGLFPEKNLAEIEDFLATFNSVGCGYAAAVNTIFVQFANRPDEFERIFGFPMYRVDSAGNIQLNFDFLMVDLYHNNSCREAGRGMRPYVLVNYLAERGVTVNVTNDRFPISDIEEALQNQNAHIQIVVEQWNPVILRNMDGTVRQNSPKAGHAVVVTGIKDDGRLIVSSWGLQLILDPADYELEGTLDFEVITFE